jgi:hypothetical protein
MIELLRGETRSFIINIMRIAAPVMMKPNFGAKAMKAAMRMMTKMGLK